MEKKILNINVPTNFHGSRIDKFLQLKFDKISRVKLQNLIREGCVKLNNTAVYLVSKKIKDGDTIEINFPPPKEISIKPCKMSLNILYDDDDIIIINKSPGVVVHPGAGNYDNTIVNALMNYCKGNLSNIGDELRHGIVHRIDKDT